MVISSASYQQSTIPSDPGSEADQGSHTSFAPHGLAILKHVTWSRASSSESNRKEAAALRPISLRRHAPRPFLEPDPAPHQGCFQSWGERCLQLLPLQGDPFRFLHRHDPLSLGLHCAGAARYSTDLVHLHYVGSFAMAADPRILYWFKLLESYRTKNRHEATQLRRGSVSFPCLVHLDQPNTHRRQIPFTIPNCCLCARKSLMRILRDPKIQVALCAPWPPRLSQPVRQD